MNPFWEEVAANVIGTFLGAGLALLTSFLAVRHGERKNDRRLLQGIIDRLYRSRALRPGQVGQDWGTPAGRAEEERSTKSVLATRDRIALVCDDLSHHSDAFDELDAMHLACLTYLNEVQEDPSGYAAALMRLRADLEPLVERLCADYPTLQRREIGMAEAARRAAADTTPGG